jgi:hypothetical protein
VTPHIYVTKQPKTEKKLPQSNIFTVFNWEIGGRRRGRSGDDRQMGTTGGPFDARKQADIAVEDEPDDDHRPGGMFG